MPKGKSARRQLQKSASRDEIPQLASSTASTPLSSPAKPLVDFSILPDPVVVAVGLKLSVEDVGRCCCTCRAFRDTLSTTTFWQRYCERHWGQKTHPASWLMSHPISHLPNLQQPTTYQALGILLSQLDSFIGFWRGSVKTSACCNLTSESVQDVMYIGPRHSITGEIVDGHHCILRDYGQSERQAGSSTAAAAAASVAMGCLSDTQVDQRSSLESEMMLYIQSTVRSKRKKAQRRCQGSTLLPYVHHLTRLSIPTATKHTWLTGLWTRASQNDTCFEAILVEYDYSGSKAQISAKWMAGTHPPPTGEDTWRVSARPIGGHMLSPSIEGLRYEGKGYIWDEERHINTPGRIEGISRDCFCFTWRQSSYREGCIFYHRLMEQASCV